MSIRSIIPIVLRGQISDIQQLERVDNNGDTKCRLSQGTILLDAFGKEWIILPPQGYNEDEFVVMGIGGDGSVLHISKLTFPICVKEDHYK